MDFTEKSESLADKMNRITDKLTENLDLSDSMELVGDDIITNVEEKTDLSELSILAPDNILELSPTEILNLNTLVDDFKFVRETLKENTENARRVLNSLTIDLLDSEDDKQASLIMSFAELNKAVADNMRLYIASYKEISAVLLNLNKIKSAEIGSKTQGATVNNLTINSEAISTVDLINRLTRD